MGYYIFIHPIGNITYLVQNKSKPGIEYEKLRFILNKFLIIITLLDRNQSKNKQIKYLNEGLCNINYSTKNVR
jgi:hypothetical protein